jgi:hypothetical protein
MTLPPLPSLPLSKNICINPSPLLTSTFGWGQRGFRRKGCGFLEERVKVKAKRVVAEVVNTVTVSEDGKKAEAKGQEDG